MGLYLWKRESSVSSLGGCILSIHTKAGDHPFCGEGSLQCGSTVQVAKSTPVIFHQYSQMSHLYMPRGPWTGGKRSPQLKRLQHFLLPLGPSNAANQIPSWPYQSISIDFIVNLPWSNGFNAIYVVVDCLTKHASFIPTTTGLNSKEFTLLFMKHIMCQFGLPECIIMDRDPRWTTNFWLSIAKSLQTKMSLSSSHHLQHDGQTEVVNKLLTTMMWAFIVGKKEQWALWLHLLEFAYNSMVHLSTGTTLFHLLLGFHPWTPLYFIAMKRADDIDSCALGISKKNMKLNG